MSRRDDAIRSAVAKMHEAHRLAAQAGRSDAKAATYAAEAQMWATLATIEDEPTPEDAPLKPEAITDQPVMPVIITGPPDLLDRIHRECVIYTSGSDNVGALLAPKGEDWTPNFPVSPPRSTPGNVGNVSNEDVVDESFATDGLQSEKQAKDELLDLRRQLAKEQQRNARMVDRAQRLLRSMNHTRMYASPAKVAGHLEQIISESES